MLRKRIVITDYEFEDLEIEKNVLSQIDAEFITDKYDTKESLIAAIKDADAIINQYTSLDEEVIKHLNRCKVISRYGVGVDTVDLKAATSKGIQVCNVPDYGVEEVSNHTLTLLLSWSRKIVPLNNYIKQGIWDFKLGRPIQRHSTQTLGVYGFGRIPRSLVKKARVFGFDILVHDPFVDDQEIEERGGNSVSLEELFEKSDFISLHVPLTDKTKHIVNYDLLKLMKESAIIINTARGPIIKEEDLIQALEENRLAGAALDVLEVEPIPNDHPFLNFENVILTPHSAWYSEESMIELRTKTAQNVVNILTGNNSEYLVNRDVLTRQSI